MTKKPVLTDEKTDRFRTSGAHAKHPARQVNGETEQTQSGHILEVNTRHRQK
ncbi:MULTISPECIES: YpzG family protein [unclassified Sporolactobacillus]|uniref:YpzG family protein n=1 Tax=unclassified Sporolactobacillus TaxID=2628533 RepID=UPI00236841C4|nr:YpzG family protein [Sporolactobacillus sp. CQH2019]MDD9150881.1 YpzG family protein [Sporolactobacillus sp. CQH2019]